MTRHPPSVLPVLEPLGASGERVRAALHGRGMRVTPARVAVLAALTDEDGQDGHRTAAELFHTLTQAGVEIDLVTVYRAVATLTEVGLLFQLAIADRAATYCRMSAPHQHAICDGCSTVTPVAGPQLKRALSYARGCRPVRLTGRGSLTLRGLCERCASAEPVIWRG
jgi:Fe2+ or Zn2+ uptake regulation protein